MGKLAAVNRDATSIGLLASRGANTRKIWLTDCQRGDTWDYGFDDALDTPRTSLRLHDVVSSILSCHNIQRLTCSPCLRSLPGCQPHPHTSAYKRAQLAADVLHCCTSASIALPALPTQQLPYSLPACLSLAAIIIITISSLYIYPHTMSFNFSLYQSQSRLSRTTSSVSSVFAAPFLRIPSRPRRYVIYSQSFSDNHSEWKVAPYSAEDGITDSHSRQAYRRGWDQQGTFLAHMAWYLAHTSVAGVQAGEQGVEEGQPPTRQSQRSHPDAPREPRRIPASDPMPASYSIPVACTSIPVFLSSHTARESVRGEASWHPSQHLLGYQGRQWKA